MGIGVISIIGSDIHFRDCHHRISRSSGLGLSVSGDDKVSLPHTLLILYYSTAFTNFGFRMASDFVSEVWRGMLGMESAPAIIFLHRFCFTFPRVRALAHCHCTMTAKAEKILGKIYLQNTVMW